MNGSDWVNCYKCTMSLAAMSVRGYAKSIRHIPMQYSRVRLNSNVLFAAVKNDVKMLLAPYHHSCVVCLGYFSEEIFLYILNLKSCEKYCECHSCHYFVNNLH